MAEEEKDEPINPQHVNFSKVQVEICDTGIGEGLPPEDPEYCPSCIIDPNAPKRNWWTEKHPYLNGQTCEYYIPVDLNADGKSFTAKELRDVRIPFNIFKYSYLRPGIRLALKFFDKMQDDQLVCAKMPEIDETTEVSKFSKPKPQLYKDRKLWNHLGKFYNERSLTEKNGHEFRVQEVKDSLVEKFEDITNPDALELFSYVKDYHLGNGNEPIKMLVVVPAYVFDQVPASIASVLGKEKEEEESPEDPYNLKTEVELDGKAFKKNMRLMFRTFEAWQKYQAMFYTLQGGRMKTETASNAEKRVNFYLKSHTKQFDYFSSALDDLLDVNGYLLRGKPHKLAAEKIKITFAPPTKTKPYRIEKVEAKYPNCDYQPCTVNFTKFAELPATQNPTLLNYIAQLDESIVLIRDLEETPWVDWLDKYTYPRMHVTYGDVEESEIPCVDVIKNPDEMDDAMFKLDLDLGDMLQWLLAQFNCKTLGEMADYDPMKHIGDLQNKFKKLLEGFTFTDNDAIKDLFGLPIDMDSMKGKKPIEMINDFFSRVTVCNLMALLLEILKCLFNGFSLDELIEMLIKKILFSASVFLFEPIYNTLEPVYSLNDTVPQRASMQLGGFTTPPWDYFREIQEEAETPGDYVAWYLGAGEKSSAAAPPAWSWSGTEATSAAKELAKQSDGRGVGALANDIMDTWSPEGLPGISTSGWLFQNKSDLYGQTLGYGGGTGPSDVEELKPPFRRVFEVWLNEFWDKLDDLEEILKFVENLPGGALLKMALALFGCPHENFLKDLFAELKDMINLGSIVKGCTLGEPMFRLPKLPLPLPPFNFMEMILRPLLNLLIKKLIDLIAMILLMILLKLLMALSCAGLKGLLDFLKNGFGNDDGLDGAIIESFCGDDGNTDRDTPDLDGLLGALDDAGFQGNPADVAALGADLSNAIPKNAFKDAFLQPPEFQDPDLLSQISDIVNTRHPGFSDILGKPSDVGMFFSGIGNLLNPDQRAAIEASLQDQDEIDGPINPSICLTNEQKEEWDQGRRSYINELCGNLPMDGFRPGEEPVPLEDDLWPYPEDQSSPTLGDDWLDKLNDREKDNLDEYLDLFLNGPAAVIGDVLSDALSQGLVNCAIDPITGEPIEPGDDDYAASKSVIPPMPAEISEMMDNAKKSMLYSVEQRFYNDLQGKYHSFFNHLLADSYNAPFYRSSKYRESHDELVRHKRKSPNAADTEGQWQAKWDVVKNRPVRPRFRMEINAPRDDDFKTNTDEPFATNVYPKTIGLWMRDQLLLEAEELEFKTDMTMESFYKEETVTRPYTRRRWNMVEKPVDYRTIDYAQPNPTFKLSFRDNNNAKGNGWNYGFDIKLINYQTDQYGNQTMDDGYRIVFEELETTNIPNALSFTSKYGPPLALPSKTRVSKDILFDINVSSDVGNATQLLDIYKKGITETERSNYNLSGIVLKNYVKNIYSAMGVTSEGLTDDLLAKDLFETFNNFVYSNVIKITLDNPDGASFTLPGYTTIDENEDEVVVAPVDYSGVPEAFMFGYVNNNLTKADLTYVAPEASPDNEDTWEYDHRNKERVLGKSATEHPRVEFLDPEIHDMGKYTKPKIYIKPPDYTGWLAINQLVLPEEDNHAPMREGFMFMDDIIKKEKDLRDQIPMDERLTDPHNCIQEGPYDVFSDPTGHAGTHVSVLAMARLYAFEHMLKAMSLYQIVKPDYTNNFDDIVLSAIVEDMEQDLSDLPRRRSKKGFFKGYTFWLLFLEQSAQTAERMIKVGDLEPNPEISACLAAINEIREENPALTKKWIKLLKHVRTITWTDSGSIEKIDFAYSRKIKGKRKYYPLEYELSSEDEKVLINYIESVMFYSLGRNFKSILAGETRNFAYRMRKRQRRMFKMSSKVYTIHKTKEVAKKLLKYIVANQLSYYGDKLQEIANDKERAGPKPKYFIENVKEYFFGSSDTIIGAGNGGLRSEAEEYQTLVEEAAEAGEEAPKFNYGANVKHVIHNPREKNPLDSFGAGQMAKIAESKHGSFYFEKYLKIVDKPDDHVSETKWYRDNQKDIVSSRDELLKGVVNIKEFQAFMKSNLTALGGLSEDTKINEQGEEEPYIWNTKISNVFGDAIPVFSEPAEATDPAEESEEGAEEQATAVPEMIGYDGSTGIRFGVRLCYIPKSDFDPALNYSETVPNKSFLFKEPVAGNPAEHNARKIFPIVSLERDVIDRPIAELDLTDDNLGEDLDCYIEELMKAPEFNLVFDYCAPIKRATSLLSLYSHYAFVPSVAEHPLERDTENGDSPTEYWKSVILSQTKNSLRSLFIANYSSAIFTSEKVGSQKDGFKINFPKLWMNLFKILINPFAFLAGWAGLWGGHRKARRIVDRPYDMYGNPEGADDGVE